jgi:hypothetical protein
VKVRSRWPSHLVVIDANRRRRRVGHESSRDDLEVVRTYPAGCAAVAGGGGCWKIDVGSTDLLPSQGRAKLL